MTAPLARTPSAAAPALTQLAAQANSAHAEVNRAGREIVMHALQAGAGLIGAKQQLPHGGWLS